MSDARGGTDQGVAESPATRQVAAVPGVLDRPPGYRRLHPDRSLNSRLKPWLTSMTPSALLDVVELASRVRGYADFTSEFLTPGDRLLAEDRRLDAAFRPAPLPSEPTNCLAERRLPARHQTMLEVSSAMQYARTVTLDLGYEQAVGKVKEAFQAQGFGTLTEIDVRATLKEKLGQDMESYVILGACNPQLAHRALDVEREIGLLLPCNVVVRAAKDGTTLVQALDPQVIVAVPERDELQPIADEAGRRIQAALDSLTSQ